MARLRSFDPALEEAAMLDLGATLSIAFRSYRALPLIPAIPPRRCSRVHCLHRRLRHHQLSSPCVDLANLPMAIYAPRDGA